MDEMKRSKPAVSRPSDDARTAPAAFDARDVADRFVQSTAKKLRIPVADLHFDTAKPSILGTHVLYQQYRGDVPISGAWLRVDVSPVGRVFTALIDLIPGNVVAKARDRGNIGAREADRHARAAVEAKVRRVVSHELVHYPVGGVPRLCWKVIVRTERPTGSWKIYIDARDGSVIERFDLVRRVIGRGRVFDPNPVSALNDPTLRLAGPIPAQAYRDVDLNALDGSGFLDGEFVSTRRTANRTSSPTNEFAFGSGDRAFREVMAYFHIDRVRRHLGDLGFGDVLNRAVEVNIDGTPDDV